MNKSIRILILLIPLMWIFHTLSKNFIVDPQFVKFIARKDQILSNESLWIIMIRIHIILAIISLLTGPLGVIKQIRIQSIRFHRWNGRIYVLSILFNFLPGVYVSFFATGGWPSTLGFLILNTLWLGITILGYVAIRRKKINLHRQWILRSFFLSFANITIYILVAISHNALNLPYSLSYTIAVWLCWVLNLAIAEIIIRKKVFSS